MNIPTRTQQEQYQTVIDSLDDNIIMAAFAQLLAAKRIEKHNSQGVTECASQCYRAGQDVAALLESD